MDPTEYYAHSPGDGADSEWHRLEDHLQATARRAAEFAEAFDSADWGRLAGLWHDLGKYQEAFHGCRSDGYLRQAHNEIAE